MLEGFERDRLGFLMDLRDRDGGIARFDDYTTVVSDPSVARGLLRSPALQIRENYRLERLGPHALAEVMEGRRALTPALRRRQVASVAEHVEWAVGRRAGAGFGSGEPVEPMGVLEDVVTASMARMYLGPGGAALERPLRDLLDALSRVIGNPFALPAWCPTPARLRIRRSHRRVVDRLLPLLRDRSAAPERYDDISAAVLARSRGLSLTRSADVALSAQFPLALGVVTESLRLYPVTWILSRFVAEDMSLGPYAVRRGHNVLISPYVIHRDDVREPDPHDFRPDRWAGRPAPSWYMPFGHGLRACPGRELAQHLLVSLLLGVLARWRVSRVEGPVLPDPRTTLMPSGLRLRFEPRTG